MKVHKTCFYRGIPRNGILVRMLDSGGKILAETISSSDSGRDGCCLFEVEEIPSLYSIQGFIYNNWKHIASFAYPTLQDRVELLETRLAELERYIQIW